MTGRCFRQPSSSRKPRPPNKSVKRAAKLEETRLLYAVQLYKSANASTWHNVGTVVGMNFVEITVRLADLYIFLGKELPAPPPKIPLNQHPLSDLEAGFKLKRAEADELEEEIEIRKEIVKKLSEIREPVRERKRRREVKEEVEDVKEEVKEKWQKIC